MATLCPVPANGQAVQPDAATPMIIVPHQQNISYRERTLCYDVTATVPFEVSTDQDWTSIIKGTDGTIYVHVDRNVLPTSRTANITFSNASNEVSETLVLTQGRDESVMELPNDIQVFSSSQTGTAPENGCDIKKTVDNNLGTIYHTRYSANKFVVSPETPAILTYNFKNVEKIDYLVYHPRQDDTNNGNFREVEVYYKKQGDTEYTLYNKYDWKGNGAASIVKFDKLEGGTLANPASIQFKVLTGQGDFASCAEMQFFVKNAASNNTADIFVDDIYSALKPGVTADDVDKITNPFFKGLATQMLAGTYKTEYRVAEYPCFLSYITLSDQWNAPGKYYDQMQGVTGINIAKGKHAVAVSGIPDGVTLTMKVVAWYSKEIERNDKGDLVGGGPVTYSYPLNNGINTIDYQNDFDGLAYICYYADENPESYPNVKVHFINGEINGYLSPEKTNEEMLEICQNATNRCIDVYGKKVHSVWQAQGLKDYCKASDNRSLGFRQYMNVLDSLIQWEHRLLGLEKYNRVPTNRTMAYVNYTYYMFQGGYGVSFKYDCEPRVLNCRTLMYNDDDAIWGLSHEWGHQHQMQPYFCWAGMSEVTNNMNSYYNIMAMGYTRSDKIGHWPAARRHFIESGEQFVPTCDSKKPYYQRDEAYKNRSLYAYSDELYAMCEAMEDSVPPAVKDDPLKGIGLTETGVGEILCPFIMLYNYATYTKGLKDFGPDLYEALRQTDEVNGSSVEKKSGIDKYELVASAQNENKNGKLAVLDEKFPNSCWAPRSGNNYITEEHCGRWENSTPYIFNFIRKTSRLLGYNLFPYYEKWGFLRQVALRVGDYGNKQIIITKKMYDEFKADMDALVTSGELKAMPDGMIEEISYTKDIFEINGHEYNSGTFPPAIPN